MTDTLARAMDEARRGARVAARFRVAVEGLELAPALRQGDISATGVYFETDRDLGDVGTVHSLLLTSLDGAATLRVLAHVVRTVRMADLSGRPVAGAALEFMPESDAVAARVHEFVRHVLSLGASDGGPSIAPRLGARVGRGGGSLEATVQRLSVRSLVLETSWAIEPGEAVRVDVVAPGMTRRLRLDGRAVRVVTGQGEPHRFHIEVAVQQETERPLRADSSATIAAVRPAGGAAEPAEPAQSAREDEVTRVLDDLLAALILPPEQEPRRRRRTHLSGDLSRIRLPTLCGLFEMERMTGKLVVRAGGAESRVYFGAGRIFDVEPLGRGESRRERLGTLLALTEGTFEFSVEGVDRADHLGVGTTQLLLELAREADEAARP